MNKCFYLVECNDCCVEDSQQPAVLGFIVMTEHLVDKSQLRFGASKTDLAREQLL